MSFKLPELVVESILREGMDNIRRDPTIIDDVFEDLTRPYANKKYGNAEINKIKNIIENREVSIVHSFNLVNANLPCISLQLSDDREDESRSHIGNYQRNEVRQFTTPEELATLIVVPSFNPSSYDPITGIVRVPDSVDLAPVHYNLIYVDGLGIEFNIVGGIVNDLGNKQFNIGLGQTVDLTTALIKSSIDYALYIRRGNIETVQVILGIHTKEALLTKYLYILVKYFMLSRRDDLIKRGIQLNSYTGSDFHRNMEYVGDVVYTRFFNITAMLQNSFRSDKVQLVDNVEVNAKVPKDRLTNEQLNLTQQTVQVKD